MIKEFSRGSEWIKCDLHLHTPDTKMNGNGYELPSEEDKWEKFCEHLEQSDVMVFGLTDYFSCDNYFKFIEIFNKKYPDSTKVFFPNVEFRLDVAVNKSAEEVNLHVIFSNQKDVTQEKIVEFLSKLETSQTISGVPITCDKLKSEDFVKATIKYAELRLALTKVFGNEKPYLIFAASNNQGIRADSKSPRKMTISDEIDKICDGFFGGAQNRDWFLKEDRYEKDSGGFGDRSKKCPVLSGCDAHSFEDLSNKLGKEYIKRDGKGDICDQSQITWIKVEPTFEGIKYLTYEPEERIFIGRKPEVIDRVDSNKTKYLSSLHITQEPTYDESQGVWFKGQTVYPSHELTAIIGNKGKGKSAITDIIGLLGNSHNEAYFSFLDVKNRKFRRNNLSRNFTAQINWESGNSEEKNLGEHIDPNSEEKVKYLPQSYFEDLCNEIDNNENFEKELNQVVFKHMDETERLGKDSFKDFIEEKKRNCETSIANLMTDLSEVNNILVDLLEKDTEEYSKGLASKIQNLKEDLESHLASKPSTPFPVEDEDKVEDSGETNNYKKLKEEEKLLKDLVAKEGEMTEQLEVLNRSLTEIGQLKYRIQEEKSRINQFRDSEAILVEKYGLDINLIFPQPNIDLKSLDQTIERIEKTRLEYRLALGKVEFSIDDHRELFEKPEDLLVNQIGRVRKNYDLLVNSLDEKQKLVEEYNAKLAAWNLRTLQLQGEDENPRPGSLRYYQSQIRYIEDELPKEIAVCKNVRREIAGKIFQKKKEIVDIYSGLKSNIDKVLDHNSEKIQGYKISLDASFLIKGLQENFLDYIDKGKAGYFYGSDEANKKFKELTKNLDPNDKGGVLDKIEEIASTLELNVGVKQNPFSQVKSSRSLRLLYDYLFGLDFLTEKYALKFAGKDIQQLSPGERGAALIVFYLLLDNDDKPLIIDQPEDNLDNQSVYEILVPFIKQAKKHRQLIIVTHNPNLAVVADAEQVIYVDIDKEDNYKFSFRCGGIETMEINKGIVDILEGTMPAFDMRKIKYLKNRVVNS